MLKGHVFSKQLFGHPIFALFINTFLNGKNGVSNNYKNGMAVSCSTSNITVQSGAVCIQGRFLEEDSYTTIPAGTDSAYCKLVIEIDLDKQNSESEFVQGAYKIVKGSGSYPALTQTDIVKNNAGIYQYELARFRTSSSGISEFQDMRTFLDFQSIYDVIQAEYRKILEQLQEELANVEDGSAYLLKSGGEMTGEIEIGQNDGKGIQLGTAGKINATSGSSTNCTVCGITEENFLSGHSFFNLKLRGKEIRPKYNDNDVALLSDISKFAVLTGEMTLSANTSSNLENNIQQQTIQKINFPSGYNKDNCICIAFGMKIDTSKNYSYGTSSSISNQAVSGAYPRHVVLGASDDPTKISIQVWQSTTSSKKVYYKIVLMKIS